MKELLVEYCKEKCEFYEECANTLESDLEHYEEEELYQVYQCMFEIGHTA